MMVGLRFLYAHKFVWTSPKKRVEKYYKLKQVKLKNKRNYETKNSHATGSSAVE